MNADITRDMNLVRLDLQVAHYYPDESILWQALRNESPATWPAAVAGPSLADTRAGVEDELSTARDELERTEVYRRQLIRAFRVAQSTKTIFFLIGLVLLSSALVTVSQSPLAFGTAAFDIFYISLTLGVEAAVIAFILRRKQRQIEWRLRPLIVTPRVPILRRMRWLKSRCYFFALLVAASALGLFFAYLRGWLPINAAEAQLVLFGVLGVAMIVAISAWVIDLKEAHLRRQFFRIPDFEVGH